MYLDRLDGRITAEFFDANSKQWRDQQKEVGTRMKQLESMPLRTATEAVEIMRSLSDACSSFMDKPAGGATGARDGPDATGDLEGRGVRDVPERAISNFGPLELCKPKQGKGET